MTSKAPQTLVHLTSKLSLSTVSRVRNSSTALYTIRPTNQGGCVVIRHRRAHHSTPSPSTPDPSASTSRLRSTPAPTGSSSKGTKQLRESCSGSAIASSSRGRTFTSSAYQAHQQPVASASGSVSPPPLPATGSGSGSSSDGGLYTPKQSSSAGEGSTYVSSHHSNPSASALSLGPDSAPGSSTPSTASATDPAAPSARATLFSSDLAAPYPSHPLPSFFGATLNVARRSNLVFRNGAYGIPKSGASEHVARTSKGKGKEHVELVEHDLSVSVGEDAYFLRTDSLGVADGVGGWSRHAGSNPARWSLKLMHHCSAELARYEDVDDALFLRYNDVDPVEVLQRAFEKSLAESKEEGVIGSSTALVAVLRNDELRLANMGDCCCSIIRGTECIFRTEEQQHSFNYPVQAGTSSKDTPIKDAQRFNVKVQKDDIVILSSDGLLDNVFTSDLLEEVLRFIATSPPPPSAPARGSNGRQGSRYTLNFSPAALSEALCKRARSVYEDQHAVASPFQQKAMEEGIHFVGGKRDDVTTLVGVIGEMEASPVSALAGFRVRCGGRLTCD